MWYMSIESRLSKSFSVLQYVCAVKFHVHWEVELTHMHTQVMYLSPVQYTTGGVHLPYMVSVNKCDISH